MSGEITSIALAAKEVAELLKKVLPSSELKKLENFQKFLQFYHEEMVRPDKDFDDLMAFRERKQIFQDIVLNVLLEKAKE